MLVGAIILIEHYSYVIVHLGNVLTTGTSTRKIVGVIELIVFHIFLMLLLASYYRVVTTGEERRILCGILVIRCRSRLCTRNVDN